MSKTALVVGVTGQDGAYLARHLLHQGYRVVGTSRDAQMASLTRLECLGIVSDVEILSLAPSDFRSVLKVVSSTLPDEIYNLAGQTSVGLSFEQPVECIESISLATLNLLEVIRFLGGSIRFFSAGSSECFGNTGDLPATERTPFQPRSPYAVAKAAAFWQVAAYRDAYNMYACTGILANHESPLRPKRFVTQKIIEGVRSIKAGSQSKIQLGNLDIWRDWGWAPDYVKAIHLMLQSDSPSDFLIASGKTVSLRQFAQLAFAVAGLDISDHLESLDSLMRPSDLAYSSMDPSLIFQRLGWKTSFTIEAIVSKMYFNELY
jgi:GDPmannose 4,6-dehydratase